MDIKRKMPMIFILIRIKFYIDINNDEPIKTYGNIRRGKNKVDPHW
jgi:hypothetical protein